MVPYSWLKQATSVAPVQFCILQNKTIVKVHKEWPSKNQSVGALAVDTSDLANNTF